MLLSHIVGQADEGRRAVDVLADRIGMSRQMSKRIRLYGLLTCNGQPWRMVDPVRAGDQLIAQFDPHPGQARELRTIPGVAVRFQDDWLIVVNKPSGMVVHPTYLHSRGSLTDLLADYPLHPVSRLDRDTSGLVLIARNGHAHHVITCNPMRKHYIGLIHGALSAPAGLIEAPIGRCPDSIMLRKVTPDGAPARTRWQVLVYYPRADVSLVRFELLTGRTHQIRVHCQSIGHPLLGDGLYGLAADPAALEMRKARAPLAVALDRQLGRQALHAVSIELKHPVDQRPLLITAPLPSDLQMILNRLQTEGR